MQVNDRNPMSYSCYILLSDPIKLITKKLSILLVESDDIQIPAQQDIIMQNTPCCRDINSRFA